MEKAVVIILIILAIVFSLGFIRIWTTASLFGEWKINSYEHFGGCWQGDVRVCDYDPFEPSPTQSLEYLTCFNQCLSNKGYPTQTDSSSSGSASLVELECQYQCEEYRIVK